MGVLAHTDSQKGSKGRWISLSSRSACSTKTQDSQGYTEKKPCLGKQRGVEGWQQSCSSERTIATSQNTHYPKTFLLWSPSTLKSS